MIFEQFWLKLAIFHFLIHLEECFPLTFTLKYQNPRISWSHWYVLNQKLFWDSKKSGSQKAIFDFTSSNKRFWKLENLKLRFYRKFFHNFAIKRYQWLPGTNQGDFLEEKLWGKYYITHSKIGRSSKSKEVVSSGTIVFAYSF